MRNWLEIASVADHKGMIHQRVRGRNLCLLQRGRRFRFVLHFINLLYKDLIQSFDLNESPKRGRLSLIYLYFLPSCR